MFCCILQFVGFVSSRVLASTGMIGILFVALFLFNGIKTIRSFLARKELWVLSFFFIIVFISGIYSTDKDAWMNWVRIKIPFVVLPLSFAALKKLDEKKFIVILYGFILTLFLSSTVVIANYFFHYTEITNSFSAGGGIPMPFSRIRFTLMLAFSFFCLFYIFENKKNVRWKNEKWIQLLLLVFSFVALHILAVRSSLLALYIGLFFLLFRYVFFKREYVKGGLFLIILIVIPFSAQKIIPSLKNKMDYMRYDNLEFEEGHINNLSDAMRRISVIAGIEVAKQNFWFGVGAGDLKQEMNNYYKLKYPILDPKNYKLPHNQLVWVLTSTGIIGFVLFLFSFVYPYFKSRLYKNFLSVILFLIIFSSFFTEATLEEQIGVGFFLIFLLLFINQSQLENDEMESISNSNF